jgi:uncharacterized protein (DUF3084 family)
VKRPEEGKVEIIRVRTLETDIEMLKKEIEVINNQKAELETELEKLECQLKHIKEENVKELEKKYKHEIKEMKHMIYMLMKHKNTKKEFNAVDKTKKKTNVKHKPIQGKTDENKVKIGQLEKQNEKLHNENYVLSQEIQYLEFKLKVIRNNL